MTSVGLEMLIEKMLIKMRRCAAAAAAAVSVMVSLMTKLNSTLSRWFDSRVPVTNRVVLTSHDCWTQAQMIQRFIVDRPTTRVSQHPWRADRSHSAARNRITNIPSSTIPLPQPQCFMIWHLCCCLCNVSVHCSAFPIISTELSVIT